MARRVRPGDRPLGAVFGLLGAVCALFGASSYDKAGTLRDHGVRTTATVVFVTIAKNGRTVVTWDPYPKDGDQREIVYDPADPSGNVADVATGPSFGTAWLCGLGAAVAWLAAVAMVTGRVPRPRRGSTSPR